MDFFKRRPIYSIGPICLLLVLFGLFLIPEGREDENGEMDQVKFQEHWSQMIENHTPKIAYEKFKEDFRHEKYEEKHRLAHLFGGSLYETVGLTGLDVCDFDFAYGCFHEFLGQAIREQGMEILGEVDAYCKASFDCQHGIGHGILSYEGYEKEDLFSALEVCHNLGSVDPEDGCYGGIFMEYNVRTMLLSDNVSIRALEHDEQYETLCTEVPEYSKEACYFWIAQWFLAQGPTDLESRISAAAEKCRTIERGENRTICYKGLGYELVSYSQNVPQLRELCDANAGEDDELFKVQCKAAAAASLYADVSLRKQAPLMCDGLVGGEYDYCFISSTKTDGTRIDNFTL